ncbi:MULTISPECIES: NADPH-dependent oxidoreductase [Variovorax]|jgi:nitroreductase|uniref:NADPH-dependent oxidoreductase n=1 Tax=Variovorax TaxID=34072 RepID=UPI00086D76F4|nr:MULTISPECIES: NADPH-dependent oxidoreductase [Variovorax]MBN8758533.1 NADPH-dependent oxidoreductase [Variovorax sp.]ODU18808.1 MAG: NADPH-dependent oxidoreductase [Variovorax sp. SCN 67-85]ODV17983.1 MAG: NADPH-dependent oxidoreductase [Variovorax sp. SCN 67-20]OJZ05692.1 MAG: NADPH-dependent oxidoreductase [Variovorax sp. 67-131]UKI07590.1 NADPH-dependent oxidoreductase [Variovorax paradoxus]
MTASHTPPDTDHGFAGLWHARYGEGIAPSAPATPNPVLQSLLAHRSVRAFDPAPLDEGTLEWLIAAAQSAPSSSNLQTWSVVAVQDPARKARLAELAGGQDHVRDAPLVLVWLADLARLRGLAQQAQVPVEGADYLDSSLMGVIDAVLAAQNAVVAAQSLGLGTVYLGAIRNQPERVAEELGLPPGVFAVVGLCVGRPDAARPAAIKPRLPQAAVLSRERYARPEAQRHVQRYDATMQSFYAAQGMPVARWSEHSLARLRGPEQLRGRHRLVEALQAQHIGLR